MESPPQSSRRLLTTTFTPDQESEIVAHFLQHGYVAVRGVLPPGLVGRAVDGLWSSSHFLGVPQINRADPDTWVDQNWPAGGGGGKGFLDSNDHMAEGFTWETRQHPALVRLFQLVLASCPFPKDNTPEKEASEGVASLPVWVSDGRFGIMRPTRGIRLPNGHTVDRPEWRTAEKWLHWDQNPWREPGFCRIQGLIALTDHTATSGGFLCVPGFQHRFAEWAARTPMESVPGAGWAHHLVSVPPSDPVQDEVAAVTMPAGSLLIWDSRLPHQNFPNNDSSFRIAQYVTFSRVPAEVTVQEERKRALLNKLATGLASREWAVITGLVLWSEPDDALPAESPLSPTELEALQLLRDAEALEAAGDSIDAMKKYRRAYRLNPALEKSSPRFDSY